MLVQLAQTCFNGIYSKIPCLNLYYIYGRTYAIANMITDSINVE